LDKRPGFSRNQGTLLNAEFLFMRWCQRTLIFSIVVATMAAVIASQALISGTFTLVNEAMKLKLWPSTKGVTPVS